MAMSRLHKWRCLRCFFFLPQVQDWWLMMVDDNLNCLMFFHLDSSAKGERLEKPKVKGVSRSTFILLMDPWWLATIWMGWCSRSANGSTLFFVHVCNLQYTLASFFLEINSRPQRFDSSIGLKMVVTKNVKLSKIYDGWWIIKVATLLVVGFSNLAGGSLVDNYSSNTSKQ